MVGSLWEKDRLDMFGGMVERGGGGVVIVVWWKGCWGKRKEGQRSTLVILCALYILV